MKDGVGLWINLVEKVLDEDKFMSYVDASMPDFTGASFGPVVHQHVGDKQMQFAAVLTFESIEAAVNVCTCGKRRSTLKLQGLGFFPIPRFGLSKWR